jgi:MSHA biogenesis protein MshN
MSVVNKMLKDLEARQSRTQKIAADYHPPQKKQLKLLFLVVLTISIIAAIIFTLANNSQMFYKGSNTKPAPSINTQPLRPLVSTKAMTVVAKKVPILEPQVSSTQHSSTNIELDMAETGVTDTIAVLADEKLFPHENSMTPDEAASLKDLETQYKQLKPQNNEQINAQATPLQPPSFSMINSSQKEDINTLKQRIADSLNNRRFNLAQPLLIKVLDIEPNNIKVRKKLASLLFSQGNYAQSKQILIQGIELHPVRNDLRLMLARLYIVQKESLKALNILAEFQPSANNKTEYLAYRASLAQQLMQTELAKSDYQTLTLIEPDNAQWWLGLAIIRDQLGEFTIALQAYNKANTLGQLDISVNDFIQQRISVLAGAQ